LIEYGPDKAAEFSGNSGNSNVSMFALVEVPELFVESVLSFDGDNGWRLTLATSVEDEVSSGAMSVVPGSFD
jgi:hypothetical protein